jgi:hypothetical protein
VGSPHGVGKIHRCNDLAFVSGAIHRLISRDAPYTVKVTRILSKDRSHDQLQRSVESLYDENGRVGQPRIPVDNAAELRTRTSYQKFKSANIGNRLDPTLGGVAEHFLIEQQRRPPTTRHPDVVNGLRIIEASLTGHFLSLH